jgi:DNA topoisomerase-1
MKLVIVESPTKAKTLKKFLGKDYVVESSVGHVRDLPASAAEIPEEFKGEAWARLGVNVGEEFKPLYVIHPAKKKKISELRRLLKGAEKLYLATDEDREGEAISWHLVEILKPKIPVERMVFHEITRQAIEESIRNTRTIDSSLVDAQETRRIIDRLYGYEVSPILWRKIGPRLSAGRVQSVSIRILVDRERARMRFRAASYWDLLATFNTPENETFDARLVTVDGKRLATGKDFDPDTGKLSRTDILHLEAGEAGALEEALRKGTFTVTSCEEKPFTRSPYPPFTTASLQQEGNRKLRYGAQRTMRAAQSLYESGFITYMRTDSVTLSTDALRLTRQAIETTYGKEFLPDQPRTYKTKVKNAQEAHEAIRPAGDSIASIEEVRRKLGGDEVAVYELIWKRTLACQMMDSRGRRLTVQVTGRAGAREVMFQATGTTIDFPGFLRAYVEGSDDPDAALADQETLLPPVTTGNVLTASGLQSQSHETTPPARLTEATLVKALEESGIGRPSTYASIIDTIQRREYSFKKGSALVPTFTAFAVVALMEVHLADLIDPGFTARMEDRLDAISRGEVKRLPYLKQFYFGNGSPGLRPLIEQKVEDIDPRIVCAIPIGYDDSGAQILVRVGRYGPFLQRGETTAPLPQGICPDEVTVEKATELLLVGARAETPIGTHPESEEPVFVKTGRFGPYVQLGVPDPGSKKKPKMVSLLKGMDPETLTLDVALQLLALPRTLGKDPEGVDVVAYNGRFGPYIKRGEDTRSLDAEDNLLTIDLERAMVLLSQEKKGRSFKRAPAEPLKTFESVEALDGIPLKVLNGRYGPYVSDGEVNASLPRGRQVDDVSLAELVELIKNKREAQPARGRKPRAGASKVAKKKATKKTAKKKTAKKTAKKKTTKKTAKKSSTSTPENPPPVQG